MLYRQLAGVLGSCLIACCGADVWAQTNLVDATTLTGKFMLGYQAWHASQGDGAAINKYIHWGHADNARPSTNDVLPDIWPDMSEMGSSELFAANLVLGNGQPAK